MTISVLRFMFWALSFVVLIVFLIVALSTTANESHSIPSAFVVESGPENVLNNGFSISLSVVRHKENGERFLIVTKYHGVSVTQILPALK